jgi:hypothetical protein
MRVFRFQNFEIREWGSGARMGVFRVWGIGFRMAVFRVYVLEFRVQNLGFRVLGSRFSVQDLEFTGQ